METINIFVSVGAAANSKQEDFIRAIEDRLRSEGLVPHTVGRNTFTSGAPLKAIIELLDQCNGAAVVALERSFFPDGVEKRDGPKERRLNEVRLPTPWNQIEAAMAYDRGLPVLMIVEAGLKSEGLLESGYDWFVQWIEPEASALTTPEFNGILASWKSDIDAKRRSATSTKQNKNTGDMTVGELISGLRPAQLWGLLSAIAGLIIGAFVLGTKLMN